MLREITEVFREVLGSEYQMGPSHGEPDHQWSVTIVEPTQTDMEDVRVRYIEPAGRVLAFRGLEKGCKRFGPLTEEIIEKDGERLVHIVASGWK